MEMHNNTRGNWNQMKHSLIGKLKLSANPIENALLSVDYRDFTLNKVNSKL